MMERNSFNVLFFLKKTKLLKNREASVCMRITVNRVRIKTNIRKSINPLLWNQAKECSRGKDRKSNDLYKFIDEARIKLYNIHYELKQEGFSKRLHCMILLLSLKKKPQLSYSGVHI